jgi:hypothetical protein
MWRREQVDWTQTHVVIAPCLPSPQPDAGWVETDMYKEVLSRKNVIRSWSWGPSHQVHFNMQKGLVSPTETRSAPKK